MLDKNRNHSDTNPREIPNKDHSEKIKPYQDPDLTPNKNNSINPETDEQKGSDTAKK